MYEILKINGNHFFKSTYCILLIMALKLMSYNCKVFNVSKILFINYLLYLCDVLLLQETWLYSCQFNIFLNGHPLMFVELMNLCYSMVAHMGDARYCIGRFLRSQRKFGFKSKRICALKLKVYFGYLYIFNVYMPCDQLFIDY